MSTRRASDPLELDVFFDYHCPYSERAIRWLDGISPGRVLPRYRFFALEQVNRDPAAAEWRLWEQPLDYAHYRGQPNRRALAAFLVTAILAANEEPTIVGRFRRLVLDARFVDEADISDLAVLHDAAERAGADIGRLEAALADPAVMARARGRIADDWRDARREYETFGVPTLCIEGGAPFYLKLEREPTAEEATVLLDRIVEMRRFAPFVVELKVLTRVVTPAVETA